MKTKYIIVHNPNSKFLKNLFCSFTGYQDASSQHMAAAANSSISLTICLSQSRISFFLLLPLLSLISSLTIYLSQISRFLLLPCSYLLSYHLSILDISRFLLLPLIYPLSPSIYLRYPALSCSLAHISSLTIYLS